MATRSTNNPDSTVVPSSLHPALKYKRTWDFQNKGTRELVAYLNLLSSSGSTVYSVSQSTSVGAIYEVLSYKDELDA